ncbi:hypothetical protein QJQ45_005273 [Haematococcus lacustris]|nr:hypothetical protein QJQ45_005273 [Haematococcus lacustris]
MAGGVIWEQGCDKTSSADEKTTSVVYDVFSSQPPVRLSVCQYALVAHGQLPSLHACLVAAKQPTTPSQFADPALFSVQPHLAGTPVAIALSWLKRQQQLQQEKHCQAWLAGSRELLAEAIPLFKAHWRYGDSQVLYLAAFLDPCYKMLHFQFSPAQFSQAEQVLSRVVTVDGSQADQPVAMALEQLRRGWGAPPYHVRTVPDTCYCLETAMELVGCKICSSSGLSILGRI